MIIIDEYDKNNIIQKILINIFYFLKNKIYFVNTQSKNLSKKINPLPLEKLLWINSQEDSDSDVHQKGFQNINKILNKNFSEKIVDLFNNEINQIELNTVLKRKLAWTYTGLVKKIDLFCDNQKKNDFSKQNCYLIIFNRKNFVIPKFENKIIIFRLMFVEELSSLINKFLSTFIKVIKKKKEIDQSNNYCLNKQDVNKDIRIKNYEILHILHDGYHYGETPNIWKKNYIDIKILKLKKIALIDYKKNYNVQDKDYFYIAPKISDLKKFISIKIIKKIIKILIFSKSINEFFLCLFYTRLFLEKEFYKSKFSKFTNTKFAIIDYPDLCPFSLIFAMKILNIKTIGIQQRFISFKYSYCQLILDYYLVNSELIKKQFKENKSIKNIIIVGQWRTKFLKKRKININRNKKRITALPYFYWMNNNISNTQITVNDSNSDYFLNQLIKLSNQIDNIEIFLKFKIIGWIKDDEITKKFLKQRFLNRLKQNKKVNIEYNMSSYESCLNSDLVISKPTSLCDELISQKIPTLISLDSKNFKIKKNVTYDYFHKDVLVSSYNELLLKTKKILNKDNHFKFIYSSISRKLYDNGVFDNTNKLTNEINNIIEENF